jgi:hypothetical protein
LSPHISKTKFLVQKRSVLRVTRIGCHTCSRIRSILILLHCITPYRRKTFQFYLHTMEN